MKNLNFKIILIAFFLCVSHPASASILSVSTNSESVKTGELVNVTVVLDSESNSINTVEGDLVYDSKLLKPERVNIGNSFISFWVEAPTISASDKIHFSGMIPGGMSISGREVFSIIFRAQNVGNANFEINDTNVYLSDGQGSLDKTSAKNKIIKISIGTSSDVGEVSTTDSTPPEGFSITRTHDTSIFDNKYFIVFSTQDKESGVDHYDVCEYVKNNCKVSASPYLLSYQNPFYRIIVRAHDVNGNVQEVILTSPLLMLVIIILLLLIVRSILFIHHRYLEKNRL